mmetsp:Transcript_21443/g.65892  ORF Transcript_21443/g.65892 Transcript_21443/m.65892 type:complete len:285 (+) Transcript_21443:425-1279(+)
MPPTLDDAADTGSNATRDPSRLLDLPPELLRRIATLLSSPDVVVAAGQSEARLALRIGVDLAERARPFARVNGARLTVREAETALLAQDSVTRQASRDVAGQTLCCVCFAKLPSPRFWDPKPDVYARVALLLAYGAIPDAGADAWFKMHDIDLTPIGVLAQHAIGEQTVSVVRSLLDAGADSNLFDPLAKCLFTNYHHGEGGVGSPETTAARLAIATLLVERGADIARAQRNYMRDDGWHILSPITFLEMLDRPYYRQHAEAVSRLRPLVAAAFEDGRNSLRFV